MRPVSVCKPPALCALLAIPLALCLSGCGVGIEADFPAVTAGPAAAVSLGSIQASDYGGHAPLVNAHIFVLQAGTGGYGSKMTSLLSSSSSSGFPTALDTVTGSPTNGMYYVTSNNLGQVSVSGDYTCTPGLPVFLYASGGNPQAPSIGQTSITVLGASAAPDANGKLLVTFSTSGTNLIYQGEQLTFNSFTNAGAFSGFVGATVTVSSLGLSNTQFSVEEGASSSSVAYQAFTGASVTQAANPSNPAVVNMATLGLCPNTGNSATENFSSLNFVYMNEISTVATAYAFAPFASTTANNDALHIGTSATNLAGLQSAARSAANLYDIQGGNTGTGSDGDAHIARATTPGYVFNGTSTAGSAAITGITSTTGLQVGQPISGSTLPSGETIASIGTGTLTVSSATGVTAGSGVNFAVDAGLGAVPQTMLDTLGNLLANCVDSANTYNAAFASAGSASSQCTGSASTGLFSNARADGTATGSGTNNIPNDTATAAINIAKWPGGAAANSTYASTLFNTLTGNVPFSPTLATAPHDYLVGITYTTPSTVGISDVETDASGNAWTLGPNNSRVYELSPAGYFTTYSPPTGSSVATSFLPGMAIDVSGNVYAPAALGTLVLTPGTTTGTLIGAANSVAASQMAVDSVGNLYLADNILGAPATSYLQKETTAGVAAGGNFPLTDICTNELQYVVLDGSNNIWTNNQYTGLSANYICRFSSAGVLQYELEIPGVSFPLSYGIAIDNGGNAWFPEKDNSKLFKVAAGGTGTYTYAVNSFPTTCPAGAGCTIALGGSLSTPFGVAVDGANNVWTSNSATTLSGTTYSSIVPFSNGTTPTALTPTYLIGTGYGQNLLFLQTDIAGNLWAAAYSGNQLVNFVGVATPTVQPLSVARQTGKLGSEP